MVSLKRFDSTDGILAVPHSPMLAGDNYFAIRDDMTFVPLSNDFKTADRYLSKLASFVGRDLVR